MKKYIIFLAPLVLVLSLNIYFRSFPINFPQFKEQAREILEQGIRQSAVREVYTKFPQYDPLAKEKLINTKVEEYKKHSKKAMDSQIQDLYLKLKDRYQDENGQSYLMELDCWHWGRYVSNVFYLGHPGDEVVNGRQLDKLMLAPLGDYLVWDNLLYYASAFFYRIFSLFKSVPLFTFLFYLPLFYAAIFIIVLYLFSFYHGRYIGAMVSCIYVGLAQNFIPRSCAGWFKKEILCILFAVLVIWAYLRAYDTKTSRQRAFWVFCSSLFVGLFCFTWPAWWFIFLIVVAYESLSLPILSFLHLRYKKDNLDLIKRHVFSFSLFLIFSCFWILLFCRFEPLLVLLREVKRAIFLSNPVETSIWPNVYSTVGELKKMTLPEIVTSVGGPFIFIPSVIGMLFLLTRNLFYRKDSGFKSESIIILTLWFLSMLYACFQGVRFLVFLTVPLGICLGWFLNDIYEYLKGRRMKWQGVIILSIVILPISFSYIDNSAKVAKSIFPLMNDPWYKFLTVFRDTTPKDSVINSWWDFGDWFKVVAQRRVIFDGQSQNKPQAYWMGKALLSVNENESLAILRMLNNGGNKAFEIIDEYLKDPLRSILLLESILPLDSGKAKDILSDFLPESVTDQVIILLFEKPDNAYFIVDYSMVSKITAVSYLGNWDFSKVYMVKNFNKKEKEQILDYLVKLGRNKEDMQRLYQEAFLISRKDLDNWISRPVQFYSPIVRGHEQDGTVLFDNGFIYNKKERTIYSNSGQIPRSLFIQTEDKMFEIIYPNPNIIFSILVYQDKEGYKAVCLDRELGHSLFVRLYFLQGVGLTHFKKHIDAEEGDNYLGSFKIDW